MVSRGKWDGWRALVYIDGSLRLRSRDNRQVSDSLPDRRGWLCQSDRAGVVAKRLDAPYFLVAKGILLAVSGQSRSSCSFASG
jgi:ATP-dependent DNA ligase